MSKKQTLTGLPVSREVTLDFDWRSFFGNLAEAAANLALKGWMDGGASAFASIGKAVSSITVETPPSTRAWSLVTFSFAWALDQVRDIEALPYEELRKVLADALSQAKLRVDDGLEEIGTEFFTRPCKIGLYVALRDYVVSNKSTFFPAFISDDVLSGKIDVAFRRSILGIWSRNPEAYRQLMDVLSSPLSEGVERDFGWQSYRASLVHNFDVAATFGQEAAKISLSQLFIPLRAYWINQDDRGYLSGKKSTPSNANLVDLNAELEEWCASKDEVGVVRLIGGGPGSGKSTSMKALARTLAKRPDVRPLYVPLQHIGIDRDLKDSVNAYFADRTDGAFKHPPLSRVSAEDGPPLILLLDGLDELIAPTEAANDVIALFGGKLSSMLDSLRGDGAKPVRAIVSGRMPAFQAAKRFFAAPDHACFEVLGYGPTGSDHLAERDPAWGVDQRPIWWRRYAEAVGLATAPPPAFSAHGLDEITNEPLLCYLLALSGFALDKWELAAENPNRIYAELIQDVYRRGWGDGVVKRHGAGRTMSLQDFLLLMRTIGLGAWLGGDTRVASDEMFRQAVTLTKAEGAWDAFERDNGSDVTNLAMNFYLKSSEIKHRGFEFTHKSFGEYLAALALIDVAERCHDLVERRVEYAMRDWYEATCTGVITEEVVEFIRNEMRLRATDTRRMSVIKGIKEAFNKIVFVADADGFPEAPTGTWRTSEASQVNAEASAWAITGACANALASQGLYTDALVDAAFLNGWRMSDLIARQSKRNVLTPKIGKSLNYMKMDNIYVFGGYFHGVNFGGSQINESVMDTITFYEASFRSGKLKGTFSSCKFIKVDFEECDFDGSFFIDCIFSDCSFVDAHISKSSVDKLTIFRSDEPFLEEFVAVGKPFKIGEHEDKDVGQKLSDATKAFSQLRARTRS
ncbi:MAG TPA: pentapeptide repeat-containing protein [Burkholderiales bacterium]|nr:pentapeptide repeat-containing protein [Burkholderiales bacterium]